MSNEQPLPGLLVTDDQALALEAIFSRNFDIVILRHPNPVSFEAAMQAICTTRPELVSRDFPFKSDGSAQRSELIDHIAGSDAALVETPAYADVKAWFSAFKEIARLANPAFPTTHCSTRSIYDGSFSKLYGYHQDTAQEVAQGEPLQWRSVITLIGLGTKIIEERKLKAACRYNTPAFEEAIRITESEHPFPSPPLLTQSDFQNRKRLRTMQRKADDAWRADNQEMLHRIRLMRAVRREEILLKDVPTITARTGDMVFIAQTRPEHVWHGSPQYTGRQRLGLVLDHIQVINI